MARMTIVRLSDGMYRVEHDGRNEIIYVAGAAAERWIFWKGQVYHGDFRAAGAAPPRPASTANQSLTAPMPARVSRIPVQIGSAVKKGDTLVVLEAMKMELPLRAPSAGAVTAIHCREGELVDADAVLIEIA
jgi:3-methylcrotonyl-CoA carboxylase alpha subunit